MRLLLTRQWLLHLRICGQSCCESKIRQMSSWVVDEWKGGLLGKVELGLFGSVIRKLLCVPENTTN
jgi:hypothetical protein